MSKKKGDWTEIAHAMGKPPKRLDPTQENPLTSLMPTGPHVLGLGAIPKNIGNGPGDPPVGFVGGTNSATEWMFYWALTKLLGPEGSSWSYQQSYQGGRHVPGGAVVDFVVYNPRQTVLIRIQTWEFHFAQGSTKMTTDYEQKESLFGINGEEIVVDVYEQYYVQDKSGKAVLACAADAIAGLEWPNPFQTGIAGDWGK